MSSYVLMPEKMKSIEGFKDGALGYTYDFRVISYGVLMEGKHIVVVVTPEQYWR